MKDIEYSLELFDEAGDKKFDSWEGLSSLPRFEVGDQFDSYFFDSYSDTHHRFIVTDASYSLQVADGKPKVTLWLHLRPENIFERGERDEKLQEAR